MQQLSLPDVFVFRFRIGLTLYRIQDIIDGDLDEIIDALHAEEIVEKLREMR